MTDVTHSPQSATKAQKTFERNTRAVRHFYRIQPNLEAFARVFTGKPKMSIQPTATTSMTDGQMIYLRVNPELGDEHRHDRPNCGRRDARDKLQCSACLVRENMLVALFHEIAHIAYDSFEAMDDCQKENAVEEAVSEAERFGISGKRLDAIRESMKVQPPGTYTEAASRISPYLQPLINGLEDARINILTMESRKGMRPMFESRTRSVFEEGVEQTDGSLVYWNQQPENAQVTAALMSYAQGFYSASWFSEPVAEVMRDPDVQRFAKAAAESRSAGEVYALAFPLLEKLRTFGFFKTQGEPTDDSVKSKFAEPDNKDTGGDDDDEGEAGEAGEPEESDEAEGDDEGDGGSGAGSGISTDTGNDAEGEGVDESGDDDADPTPNAPDGPVTSDDPDPDTDDPDPDSGSDEGTDDPVGDDEDTDEQDPDQVGAGSRDTDDDGETHDDPSAGEGDDDAEYEDGEPDDDARTEDGAEAQGDSDDKTGDPSEVAAAMSSLCSHAHLEHEDDKGDDKQDDEDADIAVAIAQERDFDEPSLEVFESKVYAAGPAFNMAQVHRRPDKYSIIAMPEKIVQQSLGKLRVAFSENHKGGKDTNRRSGKINAKVIGRRVPVEDGRLFQKRTRPGRRDYHVIIGVDGSGSTKSGLRIQNIKSAAFAQAELLSRIGVSFEVWAHTCNTNGIESENSSYGMWLETQLYKIKGENDRWDAASKGRLESLVPTAANLDGHTMEFYRKRLDSIRATDKLIMYYTDGDMPLENYREELRILKRELAICKRNGYEVVGIAFETDSPSSHGLPTVRIDGIDDVPKVVQELHKRLA